MSPTPKGISPGRTLPAFLDRIFPLLTICDLLLTIVSGSLRFSFNRAQDGVYGCFPFYFALFTFFLPSVKSVESVASVIDY